MSSTYIDGIGFVAISSQKSPEERDATLDYYRNIAPKYQQIGGFKEGFNDTQSIIFRAWENLFKTEDEEKNTWFKEEIAEWGQMVGYTDSQALQQYHRELEKLRPLTEVEEADKEANFMTMQKFESDMYDAYDNEDGDISEVQRKYGYEEEELGVLNGLAAFAKLAWESPTYMAGSVFGMVAKDPELLLLGLLRIPALAAQGTTRAVQLASLAMRVQPKYVQTMSKAIQGQRGRAVIGRGVEGATYGGVYEALHDLTFKGHIKKENVERGLALGSLLGSAFGGLSKNIGKQSWLINRQTSLNAEKNISQLKYSLQDPNLKWTKSEGIAGEGVLSFEKGWQQKLANIKLQNKGFKYNPKTKQYEEPVVEDVTVRDATGEVVDPNIDNINPEFNVNRPPKAQMPKGLDNATKAKFWKGRLQGLVDHESGVKGTIYNQFIKDMTDAGMSIEKAYAKLSDNIDKKILVAQKKLLLEKNKDGSTKYTKDEAGAIAVKEAARELEARNPELLKAEGVPYNKTTSKKWGTQREQVLADDLIGAGEVLKDAGSFSHIFKNVFKDLPKATPKQLVKAGVIGGVTGLIIADEDKAWGGLLGLTAGLLVRGNIKGINVSQAKIRLRMYKVASEGEGLMKTLQMEAGKTVNILHQVLKGKHPDISSLDFLSYVENFSKKSKVIDGIEYGIKGRNKLSAEAQDAIRAYRDLMKNFEKVAKDVGIFADRQFINDYVTHIFRNKKQTPDSIEAFVRRLKNSKNGSKLDDVSTFSNPRRLIEDIKVLAKTHPDLETDVFKILDAYTRSMSKAIAGKNITRQLERTAILDGKNPISVIINPNEFNRRIEINDVGSVGLKEYATDVLGYQVSNHPALKGKLIHPLIKKSLDDFYAPEIGTEGILNKIILVNNAMKRLAVSFSLFHMQSLVFSGIYAGIGGELLTSAGRARMKMVNKIVKGQWEGHGLDAKGKPILKKNVHGREAEGELLGASILKEMAEEGVEIGVKASEYVDAGYNTVKNLMERYAKPLDYVQTKLDKLTWDKTHDMGKMFAYLTMKDRMMSKTPRGLARIMPILSKIRGKDLGKWEAMSHAEAKSSAAAFVNDAFGGQRHAKLAMEWQKKAIANADNPKGVFYNMIALWTTPSKAKLSNLFLFSPDWTISNLRIGFRGLGMTKDIVGKIAKGKKLTPKEMAEWNIYMGYWARAVDATTYVAWQMHQWFADEDKEFDIQDFWYRGRLDLGNGEEYVVSKQIAEPMHWITHPAQTFMNKTAAAPKVGLELLLGKKYISLKHGGGYIGPTLDRGSPKEMALWGVGKVTPISLSPFKRAIEEDEDLWDATGKAMLGSLGFPRYGSRK